VPLSRCGLSVDELEALTQLGLKRLGDLLRLPADGLRRRFGERLYRLHRLTLGTLQDPLQPQAERLAIREWLFQETPESDTERLLFRIKARLPFLLAALAARQEGLSVLRMELTLDDHTHQRLEVRPANPTRQERLILELVRLQLGRITLPAGVTEILLEAEGQARELEQPTLLGSTSRRDLAAANRALAQLRAELGEQAVVRAVPREGHLPEARFSWEPVRRLEAPQPPAPTQPTLVRRMLAKPLPMPAWPRPGTKWTPGRSAEQDNVLQLHGPYVVSGGWWVHEQQREYFLAEMTSGEVRWVYQDDRKGGWFCQGWVE
ncbi:MAG TPA: DNA polymerase Y family protein, partial [bacterium]